MFKINITQSETRRFSGTLLFHRTLCTLRAHRELFLVGSWSEYPLGSHLLAPTGLVVHPQRIVTERSGMRCCWTFSLNVDSGTLAFFTTDILSTLHLQYPFNGTPIIRSLYLNPSSNSTPVFNAANSDPKLLVSTLFCFFEYHMMGALLT